MPADATAVSAEDALPSNAGADMDADEPELNDRELWGLKDCPSSEIWLQGAKNFYQSFAWVYKSGDTEKQHKRSFWWPD